MELILFVLSSNLPSFLRAEGSGPEPQSAVLTAGTARIDRAELTGLVALAVLCALTELSLPG